VKQESQKTQITLGISKFVHNNNAIMIINENSIEKNLKLSDESENTNVISEREKTNSENDQTTLIKVIYFF
jgi:hypothetical protein